MRLERDGNREYLGIPLSTLEYKMDKLEVRDRLRNGCAAPSASTTSWPSGESFASPFTAIL